jgi:hypothetical protein
MKSVASKPINNVDPDADVPSKTSDRAYFPVFNTILVSRHTKLLIVIKPKHSVQSPCYFPKTQCTNLNEHSSNAYQHSLNGECCLQLRSSHDHHVGIGDVSLKYSKIVKYNSATKFHENRSIIAHNNLCL